MFISYSKIKVGTTKILTCVSISLFTNENSKYINNIFTSKKISRNYPKGLLGRYLSTILVNKVCT